MSTSCSHDLTYDAPLAAVGAMLADPAFREEVCDAQGAVRKTVAIDRGGGGMKVVVDQVQPAARHPGFAKKFVGDEIQHRPARAAGPTPRRPGRGRHPRQARAR